MNKMNNIKTTLTLLFLVWVTVCLSQCTNLQNNCNNFDIPITNNTSAINYGIPEYNGQVLTDFIINWVDEDGNVAFTSAGGSFYDPNIHESHPPITDIPLGSGFYEPVLVDSNIDGIISCKSSVEIVPYECTGTSQTVSYEGVPDVIRYFEITWSNPDCQLSINFEDFTLVDNYVIYGVDGAGNQTVIYESAVSEEDNIITPDGTYETLLVEVTSGVGVNTEWDFTFTCCYVDPCENCDDFNLTYFVQDNPIDCGCVKYINANSGIDGCKYGDGFSGGLSVDTGCDTRFILNPKPCYDMQLTGSTVTSSPGMLVFDFTHIDDMSYISNVLNTLSGNDKAIFSTKNFTCSNDGQTLNWFVMAYNTISYDFTNLTITIIYEGLRDGDDCSIGFCDDGAVFHNEYINGVAVGVHQIESIPLITATENITTNSININNTITGGAVQQGDNFITRVYHGEGICGDDAEVEANVFIADLDCPCQSYEILLDTDNNGTYETTVAEAPNWTGTCQ